MTHNQISWWTLQETIRHNKESEVIGHRQADAAMSSAGAAWAMATESRRHNEAYEAELNRHNQHTERVEYLKQAAQQTYWEDQIANTAFANETSRMQVEYNYDIQLQDQSTKRQQFYADTVFKGLNYVTNTTFGIVDRITEKNRKSSNAITGYFDASSILDAIEHGFDPT